MITNFNEWLKLREAPEHMDNCMNCGRNFPFWELIEIRGAGGFIESYCPNCYNQMLMDQGNGANNVPTGN
jgi:hypothetical protein